MYNPPIPMVPTINFRDKDTRIFYFVSLSFVLSIFWIIAIVAYISNSQIAIPLLVCNGIMTFMFIVSVIVILYLYGSNDSIQTTHSRSINDILDEINNV